MKQPWLRIVSYLLIAGCGAATPQPVEPAEADEPQTHAVALRLEDAGDDENETPHTRVTLVEIEPDGARTLEELHVEMGACWHDTGASDVRPEASVLIAARCWWAGAGARYEVAREGDAIIARRRELDEETGGAEWVEVGRIELPAGAPLQVLAPGRRAELPGEAQ